MAKRYLLIFTKLIFFYCIFFIVMKILAVFQGAWLYANLIMILPILLVGLWGFFIVKTKKYNWLYVIIACLAISIIRYFEPSWLIVLHERFGNL